MTKEEALKLLDDAPADENLSRINKSLTRKQSVDIVANGVKTFQDGQLLPDIYVKRVHQVCQDRTRPDIWLR